MNGQQARRLVLFGSFLLVPVTLNFFSPVLILIAGFEGIAGGAFFIWAGMFAASLLFGRAFCSYLCPYGGFQMALSRVGGKGLKEIRGLRAVKYILGTAWIALILFAAVRGLHSIDFFYLTENYVSMDSIYNVYLYLIIFGALFILSLIFGQRGMCHYFCPMSVLNIAGTRIKSFFRWPSLHLEAEAERCINCKQCSKACPMSLDVAGLVLSKNFDHSECILCGECTAACRQKAISRSFSYRKKTITGSVKNF
jgi:ferredoxin-type protein NapH